MYFLSATSRPYLQRLFAILLFFILVSSGSAFADEPEVVILGPDTPSNGDCYTAEGGDEPYSWSISKGSIDAEGCVSGLFEECGTVVVSVSDNECHNKVTKGVRMSGGKWVLDSDEVSCSYPWPPTCSKTVGDKQYSYYYSQWSTYSYNCSIKPGYSLDNECGFNTYSCVPGGSDIYGDRYYNYAVRLNCQKTYEWVCEDSDDDNGSEGSDTCTPAPEPPSCTPLNWYKDYDNDGYGDSTASAEPACYGPDGYKLATDETLISTTGDCEDTDRVRDDGVTIVAAAINPASDETCDDKIDNNCNGEVDEGCEKILESISGDGQTAEICESLDYFEVRVKSDLQGKVWENVNIGWELTSKPKDANYTKLGYGSLTETLPDGKTENQLTLGDKPGEYEVDATCTDCDEGSPFTFKAEAICPVIERLEQGDPRWKDEPYGNICRGSEHGKEKIACDPYFPEHQWTIGEKGCALTSLVMLQNTYSIAPVDVGNVNGFFESSDVVWEEEYKKDPNLGYIDGEVYWHTVKLLGSEEHGRLEYVYKKEHFDGNIKEGIEVDKALMDEYLDACMPVMVKIKNPCSRSGISGWDHPAPVGPREISRCHGT